MANPSDPGDFENWITDRINLDAAAPKSGDSGDFETWITDRIPFPIYVEAAAVGISIPVIMFDYRTRRAGNLSN